MITTVVTAFPVCMCTIFPCFSKEKKIIIMQEKKNVATVKPKKKRFPIFQQKKKVHRKQKNCASSARQTCPIQWTKMNYTA